MSDASAPATLRLEVPWWGRAPIAAALGALVGAATAWAGENASNGAKLFAICPTLAAANTALSDMGRRPLSPFAPLAAALLALAAVGCLSAPGGALSTILLGGWLAARLTAPGRHLDMRRLILFGLGAVAGPVATLAAWQLVHTTQPGEPLAVGLAAFHLLFWWPVAGVEAALSWSAARARRGDGTLDLDVEEKIERESVTLEALVREIARRVEAEEARAAGGATAAGGSAPTGPAEASASAAAASATPPPPREG